MWEKNLPSNLNYIKFQKIVRDSDDMQGCCTVIKLISEKKKGKSELLRRKVANDNLTFQSGANISV